MLEGWFQECTDDPHVAVREHLLAVNRPLPPPGLPVIEARNGASAEDVLCMVRADLASNGLAQVRFEVPPPNDRFLQFGEGLGSAMPETDATVLPFVEQSVILNLLSQHGRDANPSLQPFSTDYLSLHSECSGRPLEDQPRYIVLLCREPGDNATQAQTVFVPMAQVARRLPDRTVQILMATRYSHCTSGPMLARQSPDGTVFSFRDFRSSALEWTCEHADASVDEVKSALLLLLKSMYAEESISGIHWHRGLMVVIDNFRFFHGRTSGAHTPSRCVRHLARLRLR